MSEENKPAESAAPKTKASLFKKIAIGFVVVIAAFAGFVAMLPNDFRVVRSATIDAPPSKVFPHVNDFHQWEDWSPWAKMDPAAKNSFEGPTEGTGAMFSWDGNDEVGAGRMTVTESRPSELIRIKLEFSRPMQDTSTTEFTFKPDGGKTVVTWSMAGRHTYISKGICFFMNMDKMVGGQFEKGLSNMKSVVEASGK